MGMGWRSMMPQTIFFGFAIQTDRGLVRYEPEWERKIWEPHGNQSCSERVKVKAMMAEPGWGAVVHVGLSVRSIVNGKSISTPRFTSDAVRNFVLEFRRKQLLKLVKKGKMDKDVALGASIVEQFLSDWDKIGIGVPKEKSAAIKIQNLSGETEAQFIKHMHELARKVAWVFEQDAVPMQIHDGGVIKNTFIYGTKLKGDVPCESRLIRK